MSRTEDEWVNVVRSGHHQAETSPEQGAGQSRLVLTFRDEQEVVVYDGEPVEECDHLLSPLLLADPSYKQVVAVVRALERVRRSLTLGLGHLLPVLVRRRRLGGLGSSLGLESGADAELKLMASDRKKGISGRARRGDGQRGVWRGRGSELTSSPSSVTSSVVDA